MIRSIELDLVTFSPNAVRFTTVQGQRGHAERVKKQRRAVHDVLVRHFGAQTPGLFVVLGSELRPNKIAVSFTRIAAGTLDAEENLPMAFKHVKDEIADWCGAKSDRDPIFTWGPYRQERAAPHVQRVRIEIEDLAPGEPRRVVLAETASAGRAATARVKREVKAMTKKSLSEVPSWAREHVEAAAKRRAGDVVQTGRVLSYQPDAAARGASLRELERDAAALFRRAPRDPGEEARPEALTDCETCGVRIHVPCVRQGTERMVYGVHVARARAAGLTVPADDRAAVKPARAASTFAATKAANEGRSVNRRLATVPGQARLALWRSWAALPWEQTPCPACRGRGKIGGAPFVPLECFTCKGRGRKGLRLVHLARFDGTADPPASTVCPVPAEHQAAHGLEVTLHRRTFKSSSTGSCWLYDTTTTPTKGD